MQPALEGNTGNCENRDKASSDTQEVRDAREMGYLPREVVRDEQRQTTRETMYMGSDTLFVLQNCL